MIIHKRYQFEHDLVRMTSGLEQALGLNPSSTWFVTIWVCETCKVRVAAVEDATQGSSLWPRDGDPG